MIPSFMVYQTRIKLFYLKKWKYKEGNLVGEGFYIKEERDEMGSTAVNMWEAELEVFWSSLMV